MTDLIGPANAANAVTTRPTDTRVFGTPDTWFKPCSTPAAQDGTQVQAVFLNGLLAQVRNLIRGNGLRNDGATPVITETTELDTMALSAVLQLIQRCQANYGIDTGTPDALVVTPTTAVVEYKAGMRFLVLKNPSVGANATTTPTINFGPGTLDIVKVDGVSPLGVGDLKKAAIFEVEIDGAGNARMTDLVLPSDLASYVAATTKTRLSGATTLYVDSVKGSDQTGTGTQAAPFATRQAAINYAYQSLDLNGQVLTFSCSGAFTIGAAVSGPFSGQSGPGSVVFAMGASTVTSVAHCFAASGGAKFTVIGSGTYSSTGTGSGQGNVLNATDPGTQILFSGINFGSAAVGHVFATNGASITETATYTISGNAPYHLSAQIQASISYGSTAAVTISASNPAVAFSTAFAVVGVEGFLGLNGVSFSGSATGPSLTQDIFGVVQYSGSGQTTVLPGNGTVAVNPIPVLNGGTGWNGGPLPTYAPSVTGTSGSASTPSSSGSYLKIGKLLYVRALFQVTYSSAPGALLVQLPGSFVAAQTTTLAAANLSNNLSLQATISAGSNTVTLTKYDGSSPVPNSGNYCLVDGWIEVQ